MNLEALPKYYSPKSPKLSDDAPATGSGGLTITDVMAAQGMVQSKAPLGFALFLAKVGVQDPQFAIDRKSTRLNSSHSTSSRMPSSA